MPYTLNTAKVKYKDPSTGQYVGVDAIAEKTTAEYVTAITNAGQSAVASANTAKTNALTAINDKAQEVTSQLATSDEMEAMLASPFSSGTNYNKGQYVIVTNNGDAKLYRFTAYHAAGSWIGTDAVEVKLGNDVETLKSAIGTVPTGKTVQGQIEALQTGKADMIVVTDSTPATVMTFSDGADGLPMALKIGIEPVQDLHGMPYPYPAGVTNNLIPDGTDTDNGYEAGKYLNNDGTTGSDKTYYISEYFPVTAGETYTFSNKLGTPGTPFVCFYDENKTFISGVNANQVVSRTIQAPSGAVYARSSQIKKSSYEDKKNIFQFELGSVATTPMWYSNICPISGWNAMRMFVSNKNLFDPSKIRYTFDETTQSFTVSGNGYSRDFYGDTSGASSKVPTDKMSSLPFLKAGSYIVSYDGQQSDSSSANATSVNIVLADRSVQVIEKIYKNHYTFSLQEDSLITLRRVQNSSKTYAHLKIERITNTEYERHKGHDYNVTFPQAAGTVYGGRLEVYKDGTGKIISTMANIAEYDGETLPGAWISDRDVYAEGTTPTTGAQVVYELATPVEYAMTAAEVNALLTSLIGANNIWADTGDILSVEYSADTKLYVDQQIAEKVSASQRLMELIVTANREDTMKATKAYSSGDLLIVNGTLYKASTSIANGATLTEGTNVTATTVAAEIAALA